MRRPGDRHRRKGSASGRSGTRNGACIEHENPAANANNAELYTEAVELATNFILNSGLERPKLLARSETPADLVAHGAAWRSSDAAGAVRILPAQPNVKGIDVTAAIIAGDAKECRGKFASGRTSELLDSEVVFRGFSTCEDSGGTRVIQYFVVPRKRGGFALFSVASAMAAERSPASLGEDRLNNYRKAALTAVSD